MRMPLPPLPAPFRPVIVAGDLRRFLESDPPGLRDHLARVRLFDRSLEALVTTCWVEHQPAPPPDRPCPARRHARLGAARATGAQPVQGGTLRALQWLLR